MGAPAAEEPETVKIATYESKRELKLEPQYTKFEGSDHVLTAAFQYVLGKHECMTQGWVLAGYPKTLQQAAELFDSGLGVTTKVDSAPAAVDEEGAEEAGEGAAVAEPPIEEPPMVPQ